MDKRMFYLVLTVLAVGTVAHTGYAFLKWGPIVAVAVGAVLLGLGHWFIYKVGPLVCAKPPRGQS